MLLNQDINMYDFQKKALMFIYNKYGPVSEENIPIYLLKDFINNHQDRYFFLFSNEAKDYTIFSFLAEKNDNAIDKMIEELKAWIKSRGELLEICKANNQEEDDFNIEIWIKFSDKDEPVLYYLIPYDTGIIEVF